MQLVFISDTHSQHLDFHIPEGDVLLHCGDFSSRGYPHEVAAFLEWMGDMPHRHKVLIAGNHDFMAENNPVGFAALVPSNVHYLNDSGVEIEGIPIWGSPVQPWFFDWAFNRQRGAEIRQHWDLIPENTQILLSHGPPYGILDRLVDGRPVGCRDLGKRIQALPHLKIAAFGHIHEGYGVEKHGDVTYINASMMDVDYHPVNSAVVVNF